MRSLRVPLLYCACALTVLFFAIPCMATPGGVNSDLSVWLKADGDVYSTGTTQAQDTDTVSEWDNAASTTNEATQTSLGNRPVFRVDRINSYPTLFFNGSDEFFNMSFATLKNSNYTLYAVGVRRDGNANYVIGSPGSTANENLHFGYNSNTQARLSQWDNDLNLVVSAFTGLTRGPSHTFSEGSADTATLISAGMTADSNCSWHLTDITLTQQIPAEQVNGSYSLPMVLSLVSQ